MRFFNNTKFDDSFVLDFIKPHYWSVDGSKVESIEISEANEYLFKIVIFGIDCVLLETLSNNDHQVKGKIRWFNKVSGEGVIRMNHNNQSIHFYSCNVKGANSLYPELTTNVDFKEGEDVEATLSSDFYLIKELGLINIEKCA